MFSINCNAQNKVITYTIIEDVDSLPLFPGGKDSLTAFVYKNFEWTSTDFGYNGYIIAEFVVNKNGDISNIVITRSLD